MEGFRSCDLGHFVANLVSFANFTSPNLEGTVLIEVEHENGTCNFVMPETLESLLEQKKVIGFRRATGWIAVGFDPIRTNVLKPFSAAERRRQDVVYRVEYI